MKEKIKIENSTAPIRLEGDKYDSVLYLNNVPIQFTWVREIGSTWRYQLAKNITENDLVEDRRFANFVKYGYLSHDSLGIQFDYLINKLASGEYLLEINYLPSELYLIVAQLDKEGYYQHDEYGGLVDLIQTQAYLDEAIVKEYISLIEKGVEPIMVILTCANSINKFILDGHHKFIAYMQLKKPVKTLTITKLQCEKITKQTGLSLFDICNAGMQNTSIDFYKDKKVATAMKIHISIF